MVDVVIRLYLKNYSNAECSALYDALHTALTVLDKNAEPCEDIESALDYLTGYMDCCHDNGKGVKNCPHV